MASPNRVHGLVFVEHSGVQRRYLALFISNTLTEIPVPYVLYQEDYIEGNESVMFVKFDATEQM